MPACCAAPTAHAAPSRAQALVAPGAKLLSAIKGIDFDDKGAARAAAAQTRTHCDCSRRAAVRSPRPAPLSPSPGVVLVSDILREGLDADCSVLMGANVANEMASDAFCETTIGYKVKANGDLFKLAFDCPSFKARDPPTRC